MGGGMIGKTACEQSSKNMEGGKRCCLCRNKRSESWWVGGGALLSYSRSNSNLSDRKKERWGGTVQTDSSTLISHTKSKRQQMDRSSNKHL